MEGMFAPTENLQDPKGVRVMTIRFVLVLLAVAILAGCTGGGFESQSAQHPFAPAPAPIPDPPAPTTREIVIEHVLERAVPSAITAFRFTGTDDAGNHVFGPETRPKARVIRLEVPLTLTRLDIEYLEGDLVVGVFGITVPPGTEPFEFSDPAWTSIQGLRSVAITPANVTLLSSGRPRAFTATGTYFDGTTRDHTADASWTSSNPAVATVSATGEVRTTGVGTTELTATLGDVSGSTTVRVTSDRVAHYPPGPVNRSFHSFALAMADLNRDGFLDLAVSDDSLGSAGETDVLLGNGDGTFQPRRTTGGNANAREMLAVDVNGDGILDLASADALFQQASIQLGNGDGTFQPGVAYPVGNLPVSLAAGDLNGDGQVDLAVANEASNSASILLGNGNGTFQPEQRVAIGQEPTGIALADLNGDGLLDLLASAFNNGGRVVVLLGLGDGTFGPRRAFPAPVPSSVAVGDLNGDGRADLALGGRAREISVLLGHGNGTFGAALPLSTGQNFNTQVVLGDLNGDGHLDLAASSYQDTGSSGGNLSTFLGHGDGTFATRQTYPAPINAPASIFTSGTFSQPTGLALGDLNGDGVLDLAAANGVTSVTVLMGKADGTLDSGQNYALGSGPIAIAAGDFNGDGRNDLCTANSDQNNLSVLLAGAFEDVQSLPTGPGPSGVATGDLNGDGRLDLVASVAGTNRATVFLGNGDGTFGAGRNFVVGLNPVAVALADLDGDEVLDLLTANLVGTNVSVLLGRGDGTFRPGQLFPTNSNPSAMALADLNGDGVLDLATCSALLDTASILPGLGDGSFGAPATFPTGLVPLSLALGDVNGDGSSDLVVANTGANSVSLYLGAGDGSFAAAQEIGVGRLPFAVALADVNADGRLDLATANISSDVLNDVFANPVTDHLAIRLGRGDGSFAGVQRFGLGTAPVALVLSDLDGDECLDVAAAALLGGVSVLLQSPIP